MTNKSTPILLISFNRPGYTRQALERICSARPSKIYLFCDAPRPGVESDIQLVAENRRLLLSSSITAPTEYLFPDTNLGCNLGPRSAIDWLFDNEEAGIIIEDDCLASQTFFRFADHMLDEFKSNERVMSISGTNIRPEEADELSYFFSYYSKMWGWATWRRAWRKYQEGIERWPQLKAQGLLRSLPISDYWFVKYWEGIFDKTYRSHTVTWWDYQWILTCWALGGYSITPTKNLVRNIGFGELATHTKGGNIHLANLTETEVSSDIIPAAAFQLNLDNDIYTSRNWFGASPKRMLKQELYKIEVIRKLNRYKKKLLG